MQTGSTGHRTTDLLIGVYSAAHLKQTWTRDGLIIVSWHTPTNPTQMVPQRKALHWFSCVSVSKLDQTSVSAWLTSSWPRPCRERSWAGLEDLRRAKWRGYCSGMSSRMLLRIENCRGRYFWHHRCVTEVQMGTGERLQSFLVNMTKGLKRV